MKTAMIRMKADDVAEVMLFDQIGADPFFGEGISAKTFRQQIKSVKAKTINLRINSPGGDVTEAVAMMSTLDAFPGRIEVDIDGLAASAATVVMMAGDVIRVASNALVMIHAPRAGVMGGSGDFRRMADLLDKVHGQILDAYERKSKAGREQLSHWMHEETWFTGQGAVDAGLADSVTGAVSIAALADQLKIAARLGAAKVPVLPIRKGWEETEKRKTIAARIFGAIPRKSRRSVVRGGFNEDQERDDHGRFGSGGGDGGDKGDGKGGGNSQRDKEDNDRQDQRDAEDERITEERDAEDRKVDEDRAAEDAQYEAELQAVEAQREKEDEEAQAERDDKDGQDQLDRAEEDKSVTAEREAEDNAIDERADRGEITPAQQDAMHERNAEKRDAEDEKRDAVREKEDEKDVAQREKEDARVEKERAKEDEKRQAENDRVDEQRAAQDEKRDAQREKEDAKREAMREKEDAKIEKEREKEDRGRAKARLGAKVPASGKDWAETEKRKAIAARMCGRGGAAPPGPFRAGTAAVLDFDPDQERDEAGRFGSGGGGGKGEGKDGKGDGKDSSKQEKPEPPKDPGSRPARPEKGFKNEKEIADHAAKMAEAHDADPHIKDLEKSRDEHEAKANDAKASPEERLAAKEKFEKAKEGLAHESRRSFLMSFSVPHGEQASVKTEYDRSTYNRSERAETFRKGADFLSAIASKDAVGKIEVKTDHAKGGRAYYDSTLKVVALGKGDSPSIAVHELGHHLEEKADISARVDKFSKERFGNEKPKDMAEVDPRAGYKKGEELGRKDDFAKAFKGDESKAYYTGKTYEKGRGEVLSMGLEQLHRDPVGLAKDDPKYFSLLVSVLQGKSK